MTATTLRLTVVVTPSLAALVARREEGHAGIVSELDQLDEIARIAVAIYAVCARCGPFDYVVEPVPRLLRRRHPFIVSHV